MLLEKLTEKQRQLGVTDIEFAAMLKVPRSTWQLTRTRVRPIGQRVALAAMRAFSDLSPDVISFLVSNASDEAPNGANVA